MEFPPLNILVAYPYCKPRILALLGELGTDVRFLLDSGAFSAFNAGTVISLDDYCRFIETSPVTPWRYFNLDVIGDAAGSARNYAIMRARGLTPVPIFTRGADVAEIDEMYETSDLVGIGGVALRHNPPYRYLKAVHQKTAGRPLHLLGIASPEWLHYFRPYSCDSTSFNRAMRYGLMDVYLGDGKFAKFYCGKRLQSAQSHNALAGPPNEKVIQAVRGMGFDPYALARYENWSKDAGIARWVSTFSWVRFSMDIERHAGSRCFLACAETDLKVAIACYRAARGEIDIDAARRRATIKEAA